ncbi:hypothetical protein MNBD_GAMMA12-3433 [hydrothermal vent metagenome]|uniref:Uncharacterized protein n=1 Tax=hydrothermal vent metagenome TaxID=652676 RepID=A0A3B0Z3X8_9ZZZZ
MRHKKNWVSLLLVGITLLFSSLTLSSPITHAGTAEKIKQRWPALPMTGFIKGRVATKKDVDKRIAVFAYLNGKTKSMPIDIEVPQYGLIKNHKTKKILRVIILQAELIQGQEWIGYVDITTRLRAVIRRKQIKLLGNKCCPQQ